MLTPQLLLDVHEEIVVDLFAGGGGASTGIEQAIGRHVDIAINHDADAVGMHEVNHPQTKHYLQDVFEVCPLEACQGRKVGLLHASPDCTHFSQAKGGQPRDQEIRSLAWVIPKWIGKLKRFGQQPRVVTLENVEQMLQWSPLIAKRDPATGRVVTLEKIKDPATGKLVHRIADKGEHVPRHNQFLVPDPRRKGRNWRHFVQHLRNLGCAFQWKVATNADWGCHSTRERLYGIARTDGAPIVWPEFTNAKRPTKGRKPWNQAHECIDWSIPGKSIFGRKKPLAEATMKRIAHGLRKYVLESATPFIVPLTHQGGVRVHDLKEPLRTVTGANRGELALAAATLVHCGNGERKGQAPRAMDISAPLGTVVAGGQKHGLVAAMLVQAGHGEGKGATKRRSHGANDIRGPIGTITASGGGQALASAFLAQANGGFNATPARPCSDPVSTVTTSGSQQQLVAAHMVQLNNNCASRSLDEPMPTVAAGGEHHALVEYHLAPEHEEGALRCAAFLMRYHGTGGQWVDLRDPMTTVTTHDRLALVTVWLKGEPWVIVDITLRMLVPRELYNAQDFPGTYVIDRTAAGKTLTKTAQVRMVGNSVSPLPMRRIVAANYSELHAIKEAA